jgi:hypothetical protein
VQALLQLPQLPLSVCVLTHAPLQKVSPAVAHVQTPPWQVAPPDPLHVVPQLPQFALSLLRLTQAPLQSVRFDEQLAAHEPMLQTTCPPVGAEQAFPHDPQLSTLDAVSTH